MSGSVQGAAAGGAADATLACPAVAETVARIEAAAGAGAAAGAAAGGTAASSKRAAKPAGKRKPVKGSKAWKRQRLILGHRIVRWCVQLIFFVLSPALFSAAFNGVKYLFGQIGAGDAIEANSFVVVMVAVLGFTILFGRFFCGYACAFGTLGDVVYALFKPVRTLLHIPDRPLPERAQRILQMTKYVVLVAICILCLTAVRANVSGYSPWTAFAGLVAFSTDGIAWEAFAVLGVIVVGMALIERFFCQFLCPLGAVFSLVPVMPFSAFSRDTARCAKKCGRCKQGCPVNVYPDADEWYGGECIACGKCADGCPVANVNLVAVKGPESLPFSKPFLLRIRGSEIGLVLAKAVLLLAVCWALGMADYVPAFAEVFPDVVFPWQG